MMSSGIDVGVDDLLEQSDGKHKFVQYRGERCLSSLVAVGRKVNTLQSVPSERTAAYLTALDEINEHYFEAREFERDVRGRFYRYDEAAERRFRSAIVEALSACVERLQRLLSAHEALSNSVAEEHPDRVTAVARHTNYAIRAGWYPIVEAYDHSLDPGEKIAEGKQRRRQRLYGNKDVPGITQLLDTPLFEQLSRDDLATVRKLDGFAPASARSVASRLTNRHQWLLSDQPR
jgi:hypothetical protein